MEDITHLVGHVLEHSIEDTLYLIPFLFVTYLAMEWLEHKAGDKAEEAVRRAGAAGPVVGAVVGIVPQCGFSAAAATLWAGRVISAGHAARGVPVHLRRDVAHFRWPSKLTP